MEYLKQQDSQRLMDLCIEEHTHLQAVFETAYSNRPKKKDATKDQENFNTIHKTYLRNQQAYNNRMPDFLRRKAVGGPFDFEGHKGTKNAVSTWERHQYVIA
jgi:hypothetical protein